MDDQKNNNKNKKSLPEFHQYQVEIGRKKFHQGYA